MKKKYLASLFLLAFSLTGCVRETANSNLTSTSSPTASPTVSPTATVNTETTTAQFTLPVLDAFFLSDENFANDLKSHLSLNDDQIQRLKTVAREETSKLRETESDETGRTLAARELARERVEEIVGKDKAPELYSFLRTRWQGENGSTTPTTETAAEAVPNAVPSDTRVVVNSPAYRMDVFDQGKLVKSYKIGIGYPEFPLPTGLRKAKAIIFNPTWTPPDEPWVESPSSKVKVGEKVEAGSKLNPLGLLKIPIGSPSLIHGGKSQAKLGKFASHGCVGLTDALAQDFALLLARIGGANLSVSDINAFKRNRNETKQVTLDQAVPVELRYETIVAEDGKLHIYRDVYDRNTNTEEHLRAVLEAQGLSLDDLSEEERTQVTEALAEMSRDARGRPDSTSTANEQPSPSPSPAVSPKNKTGKVTRSFKGKQEIVIEIGALKGKGYPAMLDSSLRRS
ncbi:MAG TPA: L,D-transpeptidase [Pyrinomonadaceae bacterium]|jgi:lipoprotein-anchoring transpeptidase ErfK/SrfK